MSSDHQILAALSGKSGIIVAAQQAPSPFAEPDLYAIARHKDGNMLAIRINEARPPDEFVVVVSIPTGTDCSNWLQTVQSVINSPESLTDLATSIQTLLPLLDEGEVKEMLAHSMLCSYASEAAKLS